MHGDRSIQDQWLKVRTLIINPEIDIFFKNNYKVDRFVSWDNVAGRGPLKSLLSMYLQFKDRHHFPFKQMIISENIDNHVKGNVEVIKQITHSCLSFVNFPSSSGREPLKLFEPSALEV